MTHSMTAEKTMDAGWSNLRDLPAAFQSSLKLLKQNWRRGTLTFVLPNGREIHVSGFEPGPDARIEVRDYRFVRRVLSSGDIGFCEGYMAGEWDTPNLAAVLEVFSLNLDRLRRLLAGGPVMRFINALIHMGNANSREGSKRNIYAHYDLGNAFYSSWLDESMTYSSALFETPDQPLSAAQRNKYAALARSMDLQAGHSVLEIGCGWGGFAEFAAREVGAQVTGITISPAQFDYAQARMAKAGLSDKVTIRLVDYRDVTGQFDRIASIEMFEAVGEAYWPVYFDKVRSLLKPDGQAGLQIITIDDALFETYRKRSDFIQKYIFPGGMLPSPSKLEAVTRKSGLEIAGQQAFGLHYAETLKIWAEQFSQAWANGQITGFDESFRRLWLFYLAYCEAGFRTKRTDVVQISLKPA